MVLCFLFINPKEETEMSQVQPNELKQDDKKTIVVCILCNENVEVKLIPFGFGHIAFCPKGEQSGRKHLAYNDK